VEDITPEFLGKSHGAKSGNLRNISQNGIIVLKFFCILARRAKRTVVTEDSKRKVLPLGKSLVDLKERLRWDDIYALL
jgi:hypothetical protein